MIAEKMKPFVQNNSAIRMMFEEGNCLRAKYGADKVYDFSLGNPSVPAPDCVREAIIDLVNNEEPTADMVEVAIKAVEAVFDWKDYLKREFDWVDPEENNGEEHADI